MGARIRPVAENRNPTDFREWLRATASGDSLLEAVAVSFIAVQELTCAEAAIIEYELQPIAVDSELARADDGSPRWAEGGA